MVDIPVIPPSPPAPSRAQAPDTFSQLADAFAAYIELMPGYYNGLADALDQLAAEIANQGFTASSTTSITIGTAGPNLLSHQQGGTCVHCGAGSLDICQRKPRKRYDGDYRCVQLR